MSRILLVEDHEEIWDFSSRRLKRRGHQVIPVTDGQQALDRACTERPDIVSLDMNLPVLDGWTAPRHLKAHQDIAHMSIIALTAHAMSADRKKAMAAGGGDDHPKPFDFSRPQEQSDVLARRAARTPATP